MKAILRAALAALVALAVPSLGSASPYSAASFKKWQSLVRPAAFTIIQTYSTGNSVPFTPLHTYYLAASGCSDSNNGTSPATPWCSPNHSVVCGDVLIAASGAYTASGWGTTSWGTVSGCPSLSGGIDGSGGIYFAVLLCGGSDLNSCTMNSGANVAMNIGVPNGSSSGAAGNWAVEGFKVTTGGTTAHAFQAIGCGSGATIIHHIAFINDIAYNSGDGFNTNDCGLNHSIPGNGVDYFAVVGSIAQNAAQDTLCIGAIDNAGPANSDTNAGTHVFFHGNFAYDNRVTCASDGENFFFDTFDAHGYVGTSVMSNNIGFYSERASFAIFYQQFNVLTTSTIQKIYNNTSFAAFAGVNNVFAGGEFNMQGGGNCGSCSIPNTIQVYNNVAKTNWASPGGGSSSNGFIYAILNGGGANPNVTIGGSSLQNFVKGQAGSCQGTCDAGDNDVIFNGASLGTNTYTDPALTNTTDLLNNQLGAPSCAGFTSVTACMGYNVTTQTLTTPSIISDVQPTAGGSSGDGYQFPSRTCGSNSDYPTWLKGIVRLQWNPGNSSVTQVRDLVTVPCGL